MHRSVKWDADVRETDVQTVLAHPGGVVPLLQVAGELVLMWLFQLHIAESNVYHMASHLQHQNCRYRLQAARNAVSMISAGSSSKWVLLGRWKRKGVGGCGLRSAIRIPHTWNGNSHERGSVKRDAASIPRCRLMRPREVQGCPC